MAIGVTFKAILMAGIVTLLAATSFAQSVILVLISATATGIFGIVIVIIQMKSDKGIHDRINEIQTQIDTKSEEIKEVANGR